MPKGVAVAALPIRQDYAPSDLRRRAAHEKDRRAALRLLAIANALEGMTRAEAARLAGMERQALHDAVLRFNAEGPDGLHDRTRPGRPERLSEGQQAALKAHILRGPDPERDGVSAWRLVDLCEHVERRYGVRYSLWGLSCLLDRLNLSRQKTRPSHPKGDPAAQAAFKKEAAGNAPGSRGCASQPAFPDLVPGRGPCGAEGASHAHLV
jgi:transposase